MTISYTLDVSKSDHRGFFRLLCRWRGSVWKAMAFQLTIWVVAYLIISIIYRFILSEEQQMCVRSASKKQFTYIFTLFSRKYFYVIVKISINQKTWSWVRLHMKYRRTKRWNFFFLSFEERKVLFKYRKNFFWGILKIGKVRTIFCYSLDSIPNHNFTRARAYSIRCLFCSTCKPFKDDERQLLQLPF